MRMFRGLVIASILGLLLSAWGCGTPAQDDSNKSNNNVNNTNQAPPCNLFKEKDGSATIVCGKEKFTIRNGKDGENGKQGEKGPQGSKGEQGNAGVPGRDGSDGKDANCKITRSADRRTALVTCGPDTYNVRLGDDIRAGTGCTSRRIECGLVEVKCGTNIYRVGHDTCKTLRVQVRDQKTNKTTKTLKNGDDGAVGEKMKPDDYHVFTVMDKYVSSRRASQVKVHLFSNISCTIDDHCKTSYCATLRSRGNFDIRCKNNSECVSKKAGDYCLSGRCYQQVTAPTCSSSTDCVRAGGHLCTRVGSTSYCHRRLENQVACASNADCVKKKAGDICRNKVCQRRTSTKCSQNSSCTSIKGYCETSKKVCYLPFVAYNTCKTSADCTKNKTGTYCYQGRCHARMTSAACNSSGECSRLGGNYCRNNNGKRSCYYKNDREGYANCVTARSLIRSRCEYSPYTGSFTNVYRCLWQDWSTRFYPTTSSITPVKKCKTNADCPASLKPGYIVYCYKSSTSSANETCRYRNPAYHYATMPYRTACNWMRYTQSVQYATNPRAHRQLWSSVAKRGTGYEFNGYVVTYDGSRRFFRYAWYTDAELAKCICPAGKKFNGTKRLCE